MFARVSKLILATGLVVSLSFASWLPVLAVGPESPTGPQSPTGPTTPTGPQSPTGPTTPTGPSAAATQSSTDTSTTATNDSTGADSTNTNTSSSTNDTSQTTSNTTTTTNNINASANTGDNSVGQNTKVGNVTTGDVELVGTVVNASNSSFGAGSSIGTQTITPTGQGAISLLGAANRTSLDGVNTATGSGSTNTNTATENNSLVVNATNTATATNNINFMANTGGNSITGNTEMGDFTSGDVLLGASILNLLNVQMPNTLFTADVWNFLGDVDNDLIFADLTNDTTGANSQNENNTTQNQNVAIMTTRTADANTNIAVNSQTGNNTFTNNTEVGDIATGSTEIDVVTETLANIATPILYIVNVFGEWMGSLFDTLPENVVVNQMNDTTGEGSTNASTATSNDDVNITQTDTANVTNNLNFTATTGNNTFSENTKMGDVKIGDVKVYANVVNILNSWSQDLSSFRLGVINIFGNWRGNGRTTTAQTQSAPGASSSPLPPTAETTAHGETSDGPSSVTALAALPTSIGASLSDADKTSTQSASSTSFANVWWQPLASVTNDSQGRSPEETPAANPALIRRVTQNKSTTPAVEADVLSGSSSNNLFYVLAVIALAWGASELVLARKFKKQP